MSDTVYTRVKDGAPVRGYLIDPPKDGHNFEYCDGSTGTVELSNFKAIGEECARNMSDEMSIVLFASTLVVVCFLLLLVKILKPTWWNR